MKAKDKQKASIILSVITEAIYSVFGKINNDNDVFSKTESLFSHLFGKHLIVKDIESEVNDFLSKEDSKVKELIVSARRLFDEAEKTSVSKSGMLLKTVFADIILNKETKKNLMKDLEYYLPKKLSTDLIFTDKIPEIDEAIVKKEYSELFTNFVNEVNNIETDKLDCFTAGLLGLCEKYFCFIPFDIRFNDISMYDHIKTVIALSICMNESNDKEKPFYIVSGDFTGIQNFIYSERNLLENSSKGLSKRLRGKSYFLTVLSDVISTHIVSMFNLPDTNILMNGGGHFIVILPNNIDVLHKINEFEEVIQKWFYRNFRNSINVILAGITANENLYKDFSTWYNIISNELQKAKKQKSIKFLDSVFDIDYDSPELSIPDNIVYLLDDSDKKKLNEEGLNNYERKLYQIGKLFELFGKKLPKTKYIVNITISEEERERTRFDNTFYFPFDVLNMYTLLIESDSELIKVLSNAKELKTNSLNIQIINGFNTYSNKELITKLSAVYNCYYLSSKILGNYAPVDSSGNVLEYSKLSSLNCEYEQREEHKYPLLGVLRMDVDNLGAVFSFGLERNTDKQSLRTLSRSVQLSRMMNLFFLGYINSLAKKREIYITYSGGDDLFVVGSWINVLEFARDVNEEFKKYVVFNPNISLSAGVYICKDNYPIGKAAEGSAKMEKQSKTGEKNSITVFNKTVTWDKFDEFYLFGKEIYSLTQSNESNNKVSAGFIHYLLTLTNYIFEPRSGQEEEKTGIVMTRFHKYISKIKYLLARSPRNLNNKAMQEANTKKARIFCKLLGNIEYMEYFNIPAYYVILKNRESK